MKLVCSHCGDPAANFAEYGDTLGVCDGARAVTPKEYDSADAVLDETARILDGVERRLDALAPQIAELKADADRVGAGLAHLTGRIANENAADDAAWREAEELARKEDLP